MNISSLPIVAESCQRLTVQLGRIVTLDVPGCRVMEFMAFTFHPAHDEIHLVECERSYSPDDDPASLLVQPDGTFEPEGDFADFGRFDPLRAAGVTVRDLVPADDLVRELWTATF